VNADGVKAMLATALTAHVTEKLIQLAFDGSTGNCYVNRLSIVNQGALSVSPTSKNTGGRYV
jgi:hypothetical protein